MQKNIIYLLLSGLATVALFWLLSTPLGPAPPLGLFLNPSSGFWANVETDQPKSREVTLNSNALSGEVSVYIDEHGIPHIFAENDRDLYFAQGYITARDRLWQMEFQTHAAAGRISEIVGPQTLSYDRYRRRIGMVYAAEKALEGINSDPETRQAVEAYAAGINAWIQQLDHSELPLEYKLLNYQPEKWTPLKTALLFKSMTYDLASDNDDLRNSNTRAYFGDDFIKEVLNIKTPWLEPTIPASHTWNFEPETVRKPDSQFTPSIVDQVMPFQAHEGNGSNNWVVDGSKTASGYPILANDPHLGLNLPSIWYAIQLHSPSQNVMGASLPGSPGVIIGFNEDVAWGTTNVGADVWDWYEIDFRDSTLSEYRYEDGWRSTRKRIEKIKIKGQKAVVDTVMYTHHGPVVQSTGGDPLRTNTPPYHALRWIAYEVSNEVKFFQKMNKAEEYRDYRDALKHYGSPAQNWVFADTIDIALTITGKYPLKWKNQGRFISDGADPAYEWQTWIPFEQIPYIKNPDRGFVSSANQDPTGESYPYYLDDEFAPFERGKRINDRLRAMDSITVDMMRNLQTDNFSYHAKKVLPVMLEALSTDTLSGDHIKAFESLKGWSYYNDSESIGASVFRYWWNALYNRIWRDEYDTSDFPLSWPSRDQTAYFVLNRPNLKWYDDINTDEKETIEMLVNQAYGEAISKLKDEFGPFGSSWKWGEVNLTMINHLARVPGFGESLLTGGGDESVNATKKGHGPSWRMVVEVKPDISAYAIYPGGQSGNPGSSHYTDMLDDWNKGKLIPLRFMKNEPQNDDSLSYSITLN